GGAAQTARPRQQEVSPDAVSILRVGRSLMAAAVKEQLVIHLRTQADWRAEKTAEHPDDAPSVERLHALADYVEQLPSGDANLRALQAIHESYGLEVFSPGEEGRRLIAEYGFQEEEEEDPKAFLEQLVAAESADAVDRGHQGGGP
ncbi:MAG: hypothetical protein ACR2IN_07275, partial [Thermoleophilaceae bacterium]